MPSAKENQEFIGMIVDQYPLDMAIEWISANMNPDDVFSDHDLETWAENNGFVKSDD